MKKILYVVAAVSIAAACTQKELPCTVINASIGTEQSKTVLGPAEFIVPGSISAPYTVVYPGSFAQGATILAASRPVNNFS